MVEGAAFAADVSNRCLSTNALDAVSAEQTEPMG